MKKIIILLLLVLGFFITSVPIYAGGSTVVFTAANDPGVVGGRGVRVYAKVTQLEFSMTPSLLNSRPEFYILQGSGAYCKTFTSVVAADGNVSGECFGNVSGKYNVMLRIYNVPGRNEGSEFGGVTIHFGSSTAVAPQVTNVFASPTAILKPSGMVTNHPTIVPQRAMPIQTGRLSLLDSLWTRIKNFFKGL